MTTVTVNVARNVQAPRGAAWAAQAAVAVLRTIANWTAPRAPASAPIAAAAQVRALARLHLNSDPGFAADLFAAADRHEGANNAR
ncbi:MAG TPA: hypothetical protein VGJ35_14320 [Burkholderiaceae bacterium]|jgi:hypothetical protein